jgi:hypothetical protein
MDSLGEEEINSVAKEVRHRTTVRTMVIGDVQPEGKEETKYDGDTQKRGKGRKESKHHQSEGETLQTAQAPSLKRPQIQKYPGTADFSHRNTHWGLARPVPCAKFLLVSVHNVFARAGIVFSVRFPCLLQCSGRYFRPAYGR